MSHEKQVGKYNYDFNRYSSVGRWVSYFHQLKEIFECSPKSVLEVGPGDHVVGSYLKNNTDVVYKSIDIADDLNPDILGSVTNMPIEDGSFDVVVAFEILEHIPFEDFEKAVQEMKRVAKKYVLISLPHFGPPVKFSFKVPFLPELKFAFKIPYPRTHIFNGQHYWEIGKKRFSPKKIRSLIEKHLIIQKDFVPFESQYHHFYICQVEN